ncbi:MAG: DNA-protecting protein DprA [Deltaproteobacteria bacterium]|nr:DNA-protecting protein DprA [Deltaproteobacteria bacterium]
MSRCAIPDAAVILSGVEGIGVQSMRALVGRLGLDGVWHASSAELAAAGLRPALATELRRLLDDQKRFEELRETIAAGLEPDGRLVVESDLSRVPGLGALPDRPLFVAANPRFDPTLGGRPRVAIVGTREPSTTGLAVARDLGRELADRGALIVSGGADGIDSAAHAGALDADGATIAVLGSALQQERAGRPKQIAALWQGAAVITEQLYPWPPQRWMYPRRNRLIAALAEIVIVVEGRQRSGALITARAAQRLKRPLLAVPGRVDDAVADGPNALLAEGARICRHADDAWAALGAAPKSAAPSQQLELAQPLAPDERALIRLLRSESEALHVDEIATRLDRTPAAVAATVLQLELKRRVRCEAGQRIRLLR